MKKIALLATMLVVLILSAGCVDFLSEAPPVGFTPIKEMEGLEREFLEETGYWPMVEANVDYFHFYTKADDAFSENCRKATQNKGGRGGCANTLNGFRVIEVFRPYPSAEDADTFTVVEVTSFIMHEAKHHELSLTKEEEEKFILETEEPKFWKRFYYVHPEVVEKFNPNFSIGEVMSDLEVTYDGFPGNAGIVFEVGKDQQIFVDLGTRRAYRFSTAVPADTKRAYYEGKTIRTRLFTVVDGQEGKEKVFTRAQEFNLG